MVVPYASPMGVRSDEGVLITGVYGAGKSTVAAEISYLLEQRRQPYALLDLDFLGWGVDYRPVGIVAQQVLTWLGWM